MNFARSIPVAGPVAATMALSLFLLAGCNSTSPDGIKPAESNKPVTLDPAPKGMEDGQKSVRYVPLDKQTYDLGYKFDKAQMAYDVTLTREVTPLSSDTTDDALVQNTIRDFFQRNICSQGYYPGILGGGSYGPRGSGKWVAKVKCTSKRQKPAVKQAAQAAPAAPAAQNVQNAQAAQNAAQNATQAANQAPAQAKGAAGQTSLATVK